MSTPDSFSATETVAKHRGFFIVSGILLWIVGFFSIIWPEVASVALVQLVGLVLLVSGVISLFVAATGRHVAHRVTQLLLALLRLVVGFLILGHLVDGLITLTLLLAIIFMIEGIFSIIAALRLKGHRGQGWIFFNGLVTILLGVLIYRHFPETAAWAIGLLFGINAIFGGVSLFALAMGSVSKPAA
ncbi:MAG: DUF308 domain-containing protein [Chthoniobacterales bacterium]